MSSWFPFFKTRFCLFAVSSLRWHVCISSSSWEDCAKSQDPLTSKLRPSPVSCWQGLLWDNNVYEELCNIWWLHARGRESVQKRQRLAADGYQLKMWNMTLNAAKEICVISNSKSAKLIKYGSVWITVLWVVRVSCPFLPRDFDIFNRNHKKEYDRLVQER